MSQGTEVANNQSLSQLILNNIKIDNVNGIKALFEDLYERVSSKEKSSLIDLFEKISLIYEKNPLKEWKFFYYYDENGSEKTERKVMNTLDFLEYYLMQFKEMRDFRKNRIFERISKGNDEEEFFTIHQNIMVDNFMAIFPNQIEKEIDKLVCEMNLYFHNKYYKEKNNAINYLLFKPSGFYLLRCTEIIVGC